MALVRFGPPLALMGLIFFLSAQPDLGTGLGTWDLILRKLGHMAEYGLLWFLWWRALGKRHAGPAILITLAYAATDEWHQTSVTGRNGTPVDWLIDASGVVLALLLLGAHLHRRDAEPAQDLDEHSDAEQLVADREQLDPAVAEHELGVGDAGRRERRDGEVERVHDVPVLVERVRECPDQDDRDAAPKTLRKSSSRTA